MNLSKILVMLTATIFSLLLTIPLQALTPNSLQFEHKKENSAAPNSINELWERIIILLKEDRSVTKEEVEKTFGVKFTNIEKNGEKRNLGSLYFYSVDHPYLNIGVVNVVMFDNLNSYSLSIGLNNNPSDCLSLGSAAASLKEIGWSPGLRLNHPGLSLQGFRRSIDLDSESKLRDQSRVNSNVNLHMANSTSQCVSGVDVYYLFRN